MTLQQRALSELQVHAMQICPLLHSSSCSSCFLNLAHSVQTLVLHVTFVDIENTHEWIRVVHEMNTQLARKVFSDWFKTFEIPDQLSFLSTVVYPVQQLWIPIGHFSLFTSFWFNQLFILPVRLSSTGNSSAQWPIVWFLSHMTCCIFIPY